jgi:hypothetical protein
VPKIDQYDINIWVHPKTGQERIYVNGPDVPAKAYWVWYASVDAAGNPCKVMTAEMGRKNILNPIADKLFGRDWDKAVEAVSRIPSSHKRQFDLPF